MVIVACSGGADSLALAAAALFVGSRLGLRTGLVTVDHGLQDGSASRAERLAEWARGGGFDPVEVATVDVAGRSGGPEAAARDARYQALIATAQRWDAATVLLGHTRDDQAETVLLALARGAGLRGLSAMPSRRTVDGVTLLRPLLGISREQTRAACVALGLEPWDDPHNADSGYARVRVRATAMPALIASLGPGVVANLARTARLAAADTAVLDDLARAAGASAGDDAGGLRVAAMADLALAIRTRVLRTWAEECGAPGGALSHRHVDALDALVMAWRGQGPVFLPGGLMAYRIHGVLRCDTK